MNDNIVKCVVLFADIAGSTRLYEVLGDVRAQDIVTGCLVDITRLCKQQGGTLVKTVGDEIMCHFSSVDSAISAACRIHESLYRDSQESSIEMAVRIGLHYGAVIREQGDLFGDAVNLAARMTSIAKAGQTITTQETVERLSGNVAQTRFFDKAIVKGKQEEITMYEVLWEQENVTRMIASATATHRMSSLELQLKYNQKKITILSMDMTEILLGRGKDCDVVVDSNLASRKHAMIRPRRGKFVLVDQSTNGTFIKMEDGQEVYLKREELPLWGEGQISLGCAVEDGVEYLVEYVCR